MNSIKKILLFAVTSVLLLSAVGCSQNKTEPIVIYDGQYSEMRIIHQMVKLMVEEHTDATVEIRDEMTHVNCYNELLKGNSDLINSYDGTLLTTFLHLDPSDVPADMSLYDYVNEQAAEKDIRLLGKLGINNTYAVAVPQNIADQYNLSTVSDLIPVAGELVFGAEHDFFTEEGSAKYNPMVTFYGLEFKEAKQIDLSLKYSAVESGNIDVTVAYATDGLNRKANLKILEDDQHFFPEYNGALLVRNDLFERFSDVAPNLEEVLNRMENIFTDEDMVELTYQVDVDGRGEAEVAKEYLVSKGLLPG